jgi:hypothetical protein
MHQHDASQQSSHYVLGKGDSGRLNSDGSFSGTPKKSALTPSEKCPILAPSRIYPRGWGRTWDFCDDSNPADHEARLRMHGCKRRASTLQARSTIDRQDGCESRWLSPNVQSLPERFSCPQPPWDTAFPGAFFCASRNRLHRRILALAPTGQSRVGCSRK